MKTRLIVAALLMSAGVAQAMAQKGPPRLVEIRPNQQTLGQYEKFELAVQLEAEFTNPFDPGDVALEGHFVTPSGEEHMVPGFPWQGYQRTKVRGSERLRPTGEPGWRVRYCPADEGTYRYWLVLRDRNGEVRSDEAAFRAHQSDRRGFVRVAKKNPHALELDDGSPYFAIGENVCWPGSGGTFDYDDYWSKLAGHGANYARLWIGPFDVFTLERLPAGDDDPVGLGRYDLANSWRLDYVIDLAERHGLKVMFCIESFNSLRISQPYPHWDRCPYNAARGGPIQRPEQFFTDATAQRLFKQRLRYIIARWSYSPAILSWEFWNEVNIIEKYVSADVAAWHQEMARSLRRLDPHDHLITTSWAGTEGDPAVDGLPELDYVQSHQYGARDASWMIGVSRDKLARYGKPHYFGEYGTGSQAEGTRADKTGIHLHNGLWSGLIAGDAGTGMLWWWDNYVEPLDLYYHFEPISRFVDGIPFNKLPYRPAKIAAVDYAGPPPPPRWEDLTVAVEQGSWQPAPYNQPSTVTVHTDGRLEPPDRLTRVLHGVRNHPTLHNPATLRVDFRKPGKFVAEVSGVSGHGGAKLKIYLDEELELDRDFVDEDESTETLNQYNGDYTVDVPAGKHEIRVLNDGRDWLFIAYRLTGYRERTDPGLTAWALTAPEAPRGAPVAILWAKNERYNWYNHNRGETLHSIPATTVSLPDVPEGTYEIERWDTYAGKVVDRVQAASRDGRLDVPLAPLQTDVACKVFAAER